MTLLGRPGLLVAGLAAIVFRERGHRTRPLCVVCFEVALVDAPATPRRDIAVVGLDSILLESPVASKMPGVLSEDSFIKVLEGGPSVDVVEDDAGPVVIAAVATATFPLVFEVPLEGTRE
jgi:hypothetical protein